MEETNLKKLKKAGIANCDNFNEHTELFLFNIPNKMINTKDLIDAEIYLNSNKIHTLNVGGVSAEVVVKNVKRNEVVPLVPNNEGILVKCPLPIKREVSIRFPLKASAVPENVTGEIIKSKHKPPAHLKRRDFFQFNPSVPPVSKKSIIKSSKSSDKKTKNKRKLDQLTPTEGFLKAKKRKVEGERLQKQFSSVFDEICAGSPTVERKQSSKGNGVKTEIILKSEKEVVEDSGVSDVTGKKKKKSKKK